ncbi:MAG: M23 family metallopeptidase, partial [Elusimicrobiota bacterium]
AAARRRKTPREPEAAASPLAPASSTPAHPRGREDIRAEQAADQGAKGLKDGDFAQVMRKARRRAKLTPVESAFIRRSHARALEKTEKAMDQAAAQGVVLPVREMASAVPTATSGVDPRAQRDKSAALLDPRTTWPCAGRVSYEFGPSDFHLSPPRTYKGWNYAHFHSGLDVAAPRGTALGAIAAGKVTHVQRHQSGLGMHVIIAHTDGRVSTYGHLDVGQRAPTVKPGQLVRPGQKIGYIGMTGTTTGPHVHLMIKKNGDLVDPRTILPRSR